MYKKKTATSVQKPFSPWIASFLTFAGILLVEYFFSFPSSLLHSDFLATLRPGAGVVCTQEYAPVCGKDGETYANSCYAKAAHTTVARVGECQTTSADTPSGVPISVTLPTSEASSGGAMEMPLTDILPESSGSLDLAEMDPLKYQIYTNKTFGYSLALPKYAYYQGGLSADKKSHVLAIDLSASGVALVDTALVRAIYQPVGAPEPYTSARARVALDGGAHLILEYDEPLSEKGRDIVDTLLSSIRSTTP